MCGADFAGALHCQFGGTESMVPIGTDPVPSDPDRTHDRIPAQSGVPFSGTARFPLGPPPSVASHARAILLLLVPAVPHRVALRSDLPATDRQCACFFRKLFFLSCGRNRTVQSVSGIVGFFSRSVASYTESSAPKLRGRDGDLSCESDPEHLLVDRASRFSSGIQKFRTYPRCRAQYVQRRDRRSVQLLHFALSALYERKAVRAGDETPAGTTEQSS